MRAIIASWEPATHMLAKNSKFDAAGQFVVIIAVSLRPAASMRSGCSLAAQNLGCVGF